VFVAVPLWNPLRVVNYCGSGSSHGCLDVSSAYGMSDGVFLALPISCLASVVA
jgi:hypothetical protein